MVLLYPPLKTHTSHHCHTGIDHSPKVKTLAITPPAWIIRPKCKLQTTVSFEKRNSIFCEEEWSYYIRHSKHTSHHCHTGIDHSPKVKTLAITPPAWIIRPKCKLQTTTHHLRHRVSDNPTPGSRYAGPNPLSTSS